jgi:4-hydroxy-tetrahydrodipicolinate reductase
MDAKVSLIGAGEIGLAVLKAAALKGFLPENVYDSAPEKAGSALSILEPYFKSDIRIKTVSEEAVNKEKAPLIIICASSVPGISAGLAIPFLKKGISVLTSCEELAFPTEKTGTLIKEIHAAAVSGKAAFLAGGINPGFIMDYLPAIMLAASSGVKKVIAERRINTADRRINFIRKTGAGLDLKTFEEKLAAGELGHKGLACSVSMIAAAMQLDGFEMMESVFPLISEQEIINPALTIKPGHVCGISQTCTCISASEEKIRLTFTAAADESAPEDNIEIYGNTNIKLHIEKGLNGDGGTVSVLTSAIPAVLKLTPGYHTMLDFTFFGGYK